jgi:hypothetical protein
MNNQNYKHGITGVNESTEQSTKALEFFKDWTNYLLVTSVAAMGWFITDESVCGLPKDIAIVSLALSIVFAILTLSIIPIIAERIEQEQKSIYLIRAPFKLFFNFINCSIRIKLVCFPQHMLFIIGICSYAYGAVFH